MVRADLKRDYYADLELPVNATDDEVRKQFRLLGMEYWMLMKEGADPVQRNCTTQIETRATRWSLFRNFKLYKQRMRS